jgi:hypothetical protein
MPSPDQQRLQGTNLFNDFAYQFFVPYFDAEGSGVVRVSDSVTFDDMRRWFKDLQERLDSQQHAIEQTHDVLVKSTRRLLRNYPDGSDTAIEELNQVPSSLRPFLKTP